MEQTFRFQPTIARAALVIVVLALAVPPASLARSVPPAAPDWWQNPPPSQPGYPVPLSSAVFFINSSPALADLDNNGAPEVIIGGRQLVGGSPGCGGMVYAYRADGSLLWQASVRAPVNATPTVADLNGDGYPDVIVPLGGLVASQCWHGGVTALNGLNGQALWTFDTQDWLNHSPDGWLDGVISTPAVGDVNGDGYPEIAFGAWDQCIYLLNRAGQPLWGNLPGILPQVYCGGHGFYNEDTIWSSPALADVTGDGRLEIIIGADISAGNVWGDPNGGYLYILNADGTTLAREWMDQVIYSSPAVADLDQDGAFEFVVGTGTYWPGTGHYVSAFDYDPNPANPADRLVLRWRRTTAGRVFASPAIADLNGDGWLDVVITSFSGDDGQDGTIVYAWRGSDGTPLFQRRACNYLGQSGNTVASPTVADVDGDAGPEILFGHLWEVAVLNADGTYYSDYSNPLGGSPIHPGCARDHTPTTNLTYLVNYSAYASPAVGNLDGDGDREVVVGAHDPNDSSRGAIYAWSGHAGSAAPWPQFHHDAQHTGNFCFAPRPPTNPALNSDPPANVWTNDNTVHVTWSGASTDSACGVRGYSIQWSDAPGTVPDRIVDTSGNAVTTPLADGVWYFHLRTFDGFGTPAATTVHLGPFQIDTVVPTSQAASPTGYTTNPAIPVTWSGSDVGSGIASYDVQVQTDGGAWQNWQTDVTFTAAVYNATAGHVYCFRSRAEDQAGNVEAYPAGADSCVTVAQHALSGSVWNNRGQPVLGALVSADPPMVNTARSAVDGSFALYFNTPGAYDLDASRNDFGKQPASHYTLAGDLSGVFFVLPPLDDLVLNGGFEDGVQHWAVAGATVAADAHSGDSALAFDGGDVATQTVNLPGGLLAPTLSLVYRVEGSVQPSDRFTVTARCVCRTVTLSLPLDATDWSHAWADTSGMGGAVQVTLQSDLDSASVLIDEVTLGSSWPGAYRLFLPVALRGG